MMITQFTHLPGSLEAVAEGCTCQLDIIHDDSKGLPTALGRRHVSDPACPVHFFSQSPRIVSAAPSAGCRPSPQTQRAMKKTVMKGAILKRKAHGRFDPFNPEAFTASARRFVRGDLILAAGGSRLILTPQMRSGVDNGGVRKCLRKIAEKTLRYGVVFLGE